jgi:hypothetical protein
VPGRIASFGPKATSCFQLRMSGQPAWPESAAAGSRPEPQPAWLQADPGGRLNRPPPLSAQQERIRLGPACGHSSAKLEQPQVESYAKGFLERRFSFAMQLRLRGAPQTSWLNSCEGRKTSFPRCHHHLHTCHRERCIHIRSLPHIAAKQRAFDGGWRFLNQSKGRFSISLASHVHVALVCNPAGIVGFDDRRFPSRKHRLSKIVREFFFQP